MGFPSIVLCGVLMEDSYFHEFKKKACFFFKQRVKIARLALTDVTHAQLLTEEATSGNPWPPDSATMREITRATFEVDEFYRIVEILHKRLEKFEAKDWRASYNAVILVEHALTHGPHSFAKEFQNYKHVLREMDGFQFVDEKGFNWGQRVRKLSARVLKLLEEEEFLVQERIKARKLTRGIQGFGSFSRWSLPTTGDSDAGRFNCDRAIQMAAARENIAMDEKEDLKGLGEDDGRNKEIDHPFCEMKYYQVSESLISSV